MTVHVCTIVAANYLPFARVLWESFFSHHPAGTFVLLIIDDEQKAVDVGDGRVERLGLRDLGLDLPEIHRLAGIYDVTELATAVKPLLLRKLVERLRCPVAYLDPDIQIHGSLAPAISLAADHGIVLTPHTMRPYPQDGLQVDAAFILSAGVYNLGFVAIGPGATPFLEWWWQRTRRDALSDVSRNMFTDQRWVDFVPSFFDHALLKDPGWNVAYWNLHGRHLTFDDGRYLVDGLPLTFFHFSGFDPARPSDLSKHQGANPRVRPGDSPALDRLCRDYAAALGSAGLDPLVRPSYGWNRTAAGMVLTTRIRRLYRAAVIAAEEDGASPPPDPFDAENPDAFPAWLNRPEGVGLLSRYLISIYRERIDLQIQFPDIEGRDAARFAEWIWADSDLRETTPMELLPPARIGSQPPATASAPPQDVPSSGDTSGPGLLAAMLPNLEQMSAVNLSADGGSAGWRHMVQRALFRILRPYAFQQEQLHRSLIDALRQATLCLQRQQQLHESLSTRVRELTTEVVATQREIRRLERTKERTDGE